MPVASGPVPACHMRMGVVCSRAVCTFKGALKEKSACIACRLSRQSYLGVIHYTLLLMLFGAAAFKAVHTPLLTAMLLSELASLLCLAGKMQAGLPPLSYLHPLIPVAGAGFQSNGCCPGL